QNGSPNAWRCWPMRQPSGYWLCPRRISRPCWRPPDTGSRCTVWQLDYPWLLLLLPLPWLARRYLGTYRESRSALRVPFFAAMSRAVGQEPGSARAEGDRWQLPLNLLVWGLVLLACARPVLVEKPIERELPVRD